MILTGARWALNGESASRTNLEIRNGAIYPCSRRTDRNTIDLAGLLLLPGLINAHDHLEFNLFPRLGRRIYRNASEWATDIYRPLESPVREHVSIPLPVRLVWGGIRNLLCGATTVAHHNPYHPSVFGRSFPVRVVREFGWAHSLDYSPDLPERFRNTPRGWPFIVHAAEGTDRHAGSEIARLAELGLLARNTVLVHGIGAGCEDVDLIRSCGTSVICCPRSNLATYGRTLSREALESGVPIALGTDSAITSHGDLIDEIRTAVVECGVSASSVYRMVTTDAAAILRLSRGEGLLCAGGVADMVGVPDEGQSPAEALLNLRPEFVMWGGRFRMLSQALAAGSLSAFAKNLQSIGIGSREPCLIDADVASLHGEAARAIGPDVQLCGRVISVEAAA